MMQKDDQRSFRRLPKHQRSSDAGTEMTTKWKWHGRLAFSLFNSAVITTAQEGQVRLKLSTAGEVENREGAWGDVRATCQLVSRRLVRAMTRSDYTNCHKTTAMTKTTAHFCQFHDCRELKRALFSAIASCTRRN
jgi:hypothetical protein